ncbi:hypothetical protein AB4305_34470 [Nocardia sp. 2YAB30]|uniref:hypothetical protein n=1 Tax=Nocardia sp. 2YAB30 TaxID=3233022 RepID=UPI003F950685
MTGTNPAADTRFLSSNTTDPTANVCDDLTENASRFLHDPGLDNHDHPRSKGILSISHTNCDQHPIHGSRLSAVTRGFVFHASDRLFTVEQRGQVKPWDPKANKTLVVVGDDCWLVLAYTGLAYLDKRPTDQFLAEAISGVPDLPGGGLRFTHRPPGLHYAEIVRRIADAVPAAYERLSSDEKKVPLIVAGTGIQLTRPRNRELTFKLGFSESGFDGGDAFTRRYPSIWSFSCIPAGDVNPAVHERTRARLRDETHDSPESFRKILVDSVQETAAHSKYVGQDVISVILRPDARLINVHFDPADPDERITPRTAPYEKEDRHKLEVYTPYVLLPHSIFSLDLSPGLRPGVIGLGLGFCC